MPADGRKAAGAALLGATLPGRSVPSAESLAPYAR